MLDLDHTLIHSEEYELVNKAIAHKNGRDKNAKKGDIASGGVISVITSMSPIPSASGRSRLVQVRSIEAVSSCSM